MQKKDKSNQQIISEKDLNSLNDKIKNKELEPVEYFYILMKKNPLPEDIKEKCLKLIKQSKQLAIQILDVANELNKDWKEYDFEQINYENSGFLSKVVVNFKDIIQYAEPVFTTNKQEGKYEAAFNFICACKDNKLIQRKKGLEKTKLVSKEKNRISELNEMVQKKRWVMDINEVSVKKRAGNEYTVTLTLYLNNKVITVSGTSNYKKEAKNKAINLLFKNHKKDMNKEEAPEEKEESENYVGLLHEKIQKNKWAPINYAISSHKAKFSFDKNNQVNFECRASIKINEKVYVSNLSIGKTKKIVKHKAAESLLGILDQLVEHKS